MERKKKGKGGIKGVGDKEKGGWRKGKGGILCSCDFSSGKTLEKKRRDNCRPSLLARVCRPVVMRGSTIKSCGDGVVFVFARWRLVGVDRQAVVGPANGPLSTNQIKQL